MEEENVEQQLQQIVNSAELVEAPAMPAQTVEYAGFWVRLLAYLIDVTIFRMVVVVLGIILIFILRLLYIVIPALLYTRIPGIFAILVGIIFGYYYFIYYLYKNQATLGKRIVGIKLEMDNGRKASLKTVIKREIFGKFLSGITLGVGYFMIAFTEKKQGLHDKIFDTVVVCSPIRKKIEPLVAAGYVIIIIVFYIIITFAYGVLQAFLK